MEAELAAAEALLEKGTDIPSFLDDALKQYNESRAKGEKTSVDLRIDSAVAQLESLKGQFIAVATTQLFLERIAGSAASGDGDSMPSITVQELAETELAAEQQKAKLKKVKHSRASSAARLEACSKELATLRIEEEDTRAALKRQVDNVRSAQRLKVVTEVLENGTDDEVHQLASNIEEHDAKACEQILEKLHDALSKKRQERGVVEEEVAELQAEIDRQVKKQAELNTDLSDYRADVEKNERKNADAPQLREEALWHQKLYEAVSSLTRARLVNVYENGLLVELTVDRPVQDDEGEKDGDEGVRFESVIYKLDMTITSRGESLVTSLKLEPPDIDTSEIVSPDDPLTLLEVTQEAIASLAPIPVRRALK